MPLPIDEHEDSAGGGTTILVQTSCGMLTRTIIKLKPYTSALLDVLMDSHVM